MELDLYCTEPHPARIGEIARQTQAAGFAGLWVTEAAHNPYIASALAAEAADRLVIGTDVAIAFPRSPMVTAQAAWDLAALSGGRFILGLGTQVKAHLERRFSVPGDRLAPRIREYIVALRAIFDAFAKREKLRFEGEFHRFSLLTDFFDPGPIEVADPPVYLAGPALWAALSILLGLGLALAALYADRLPDWLRRRLARAWDPAAATLQGLHNGQIGDSVTWLVVGLAGFGALLALVVR